MQALESSRRRWPVMGLALLLAAPWAGLSQPSPDRLARSPDPITGPRSRLNKDWQGLRPMTANTPILVMPGHADSQGFGSGASGAAVAVMGQRPMDSTMSDELYWNLATVEAVVRLGQLQGLRIQAYDPGTRRLANGNDPRTTWSVGKAHVAAGGYALEIHYDAHGPDGVGSGLIPPLQASPSRLDESLARAFGAFPQRFRDGLGAPKRGIAILEIGKLEGSLEGRLRNPELRQVTLEAIALRVVEALRQGLEPDPFPPLTPPPDAVGSAPPGQDRRASFGGE